MVVYSFIRSLLGNNDVLLLSIASIMTKYSPKNNPSPNISKGSPRYYATLFTYVRINFLLPNYLNPVSPRFHRCY